MSSRLRTRLLSLLKLPAEPQPPSGAPGSVRVFRAGRNFYKLSILRWSVGQVAAAFGIIVSIGFLWKLEADVSAVLSQSPPPAQATYGDRTDRPVDRGERNEVIEAWRAHGLPAKVAPHASWLIPLVNVIEAFGIASFFVQLVLTWMILRLEYELRWYMVTDRSLRIRTGVWKVQESTMSFANLQQVELSQGPLQRLLGIADVRVQSAGGGGGKTAEKNQQEDSLHTGVFHGVTNAHEIRDLIQARLRNYRESGLGDPDDSSGAPPCPPQKDPAVAGRASVSAAMAELLAEARALRRLAP